MQTIKPISFGVDGYESWVQREGLPVSEGIAINAFQMPTGDWPRYGVKGGAGHCTGRGDFASFFALEIPAGKATTPVQHIFECTCYVLEGRGSTQLEFPDGSKRSFEWNKNSFFAIPLNARYRHFNASGFERVLMTMVTNAPLMMKTFHNDDFVFNCPFMFTDRVGREEWYGGEGELHMSRPGNHVWETNFVPDMLAIELPEWEDRGKGSTSISFALGGSVQHTHVSEIAAATYKKAHRHGSGTHVMTLSGKGYSLLWNEGDTDFSRVDWDYGVVFPPCEGQFHQHFVTSNNASRYVAVGASSTRWPLQESRKRAYFGNGVKQATSLSTKLGGQQIEYEDQDPRIHQIWLEEMRKAGITPLLELPVRVMRRAPFLAATAAASFFPSRVRAQGLAKIRVASTVTEDVLGVLWGVESGIFQRAGLDVSVEHSSSGAAISEAVISGALDLGKSSIIALLAGHLRGLPFVLEAPGGVYVSSDANAALVVRKDSPLRTGRDFNGKTLAVPALNDLFALGTSAWIDRGGGDSKTVKYLELPGPAQSDSIAAGRIDGAMMAEPLVSQGVQAGKIRILSHPYDAIAKNFAVTLFFTSADFATKNPATLAAFRRAFAESVAYVTSHRAETLPVYSKFSGIQMSVLMSAIPNHMGTTLDPRMIQPVIDVAAKYGVIQRAFPASELFDKNG